jgi:peptidoglycan biosynthesis protein MviN/MurJ (putative lipid II flippase)
VLAFVLSGVSQVEQNYFFNAIARGFPQLGYQPDSGHVGGLALANTLGTAFEVLVLLWILQRRWHGTNEDALARTTLKTVTASLVMALAIVMVNAAWNMLGLSGRGFSFTVLQVALEVSIGGMVFLAVSYRLKLEELQTILRLILRRPKMVETTA